MSIGPRLSEGRTAEVFAWGETQILKLFRDWCPASWVGYEHWIARLAEASGLDVPAVGEMVEAGGRRGIVYARVEGPSLLAQAQGSGEGMRTKQFWGNEGLF